jgi:hypothetical protein
VGAAHATITLGSPTLQAMPWRNLHWCGKINAKSLLRSSLLAPSDVVTNLCTSAQIKRCIVPDIGTHVHRVACDRLDTTRVKGYINEKTYSQLLIVRDRNSTLSSKPAERKTVCREVCSSTSLHKATNFICQTAGMLHGRIGHHHSCDEFLPALHSYHPSIRSAIRY